MRRTDGILGQHFRAPLIHTYGFSITLLTGNKRNVGTVVSGTFVQNIDILPMASALNKRHKQSRHFL